ncbi:hypothetical protein EDI_056210 [Entamoeba dispar SAW760]|uniref:Uncharacterized protein n=1 Tax=Entamoeba dispar (strain ATCC PRA-260 / SAW760) TaxID=370354 RepID=B0EDP6_ENTDS|nr:uncharacterized protein EDI_056210 [Entamoeba dispar SAW760]EDR27350.1 hypothetical protein EDI_056210 [Entamoeba dispar SAW760]|eukprot:EDR27350.1 hypothetical protein EDI_056210 [Entamoeba dispar SAW760]
MTSNEKFEKIAKEIMSSTIKKIVRFKCSDKPANDPRETSDQDLTETLLQIGTIPGGPNDLEYIMWGDSGTANFLISLEDLKACNFTRVGYIWDC